MVSRINNFFCDQLLLSVGRFSIGWGNFLNLFGSGLSGLCVMAFKF